MRIGIGGEIDGAVLDTIARTPSLRGLVQLTLQPNVYARGAVKVEAAQLRNVIEALPGLRHLSVADQALPEDLQAVLRARLQ